MDRGSQVEETVREEGDRDRFGRIDFHSLLMELVERHGVCIR